MIEYRDEYTDDYVNDAHTAQPPQVKRKRRVVVCDGCGVEDVPMWNFQELHLCEDCLLDAAKEYFEEVEV